MKNLVLLCGFVTSAFVAYLLYTPVPDSMTEPWKYRVVIAERKLIQLIALLQTYIFSTSFVANVRTLRHQSNSVLSIFKSKEDFTTNSTYTTFDGVRVLFYTPMVSKSDNLQPAFIYIHGGGRSFGSTVLYEGLTRQLAERLQIPTISIEYRLAPENSRLSDYEDCVKATLWFLKHAEQYGVDRTQVAIGGDSAGGSLSASLAQHVHDQPGMSDFKLQVLIYPNTQGVDLNLPSHQMYRYHFGEAGFLSVKAIAIFTSLYFLEAYNVDFVNTVMASNHTMPALKAYPELKEYLDHDLVPENLRDPKYYTAWKDNSHGDTEFWEKHRDVILDVRFNPGLRKDLSNLPPALITTCDLDSLRDDGIIYAKRLEKAGVPVKLINYDGAFHAITWTGGGLPNILDFHIGKQMIDDIVDHMKLVLKLS